MKTLILLSLLLSSLSGIAGEIINKNGDTLSFHTDEDYVLTITSSRLNKSKSIKIGIVENRSDDLAQKKEGVAFPVFTMLRESINMGDAALVIVPGLNFAAATAAAIDVIMMPVRLPIKLSHEARNRKDVAALKEALNSADDKIIEVNDKRFNRLEKMLLINESLTTPRSNIRYYITE